jgi:hypothetical protein
MGKSKINIKLKIKVKEEIKMKNQIIRFEDTFFSGIKPIEPKHVYPARLEKNYLNTLDRYEFRDLMHNEKLKMQILKKRVDKALEDIERSYAYFGKRIERIKREIRVNSKKPLTEVKKRRINRLKNNLLKVQKQKKRRITSLKETYKKILKNYNKAKNNFFRLYYEAKERFFF